MKNQILLGNSVIVTDPCYDTNTWCQAKVENVLEGKYDTCCNVVDTGDWGKRNASLIAIHENYRGEELNWEIFPAEIGVDSGQAGIFDIRDYRKDGLEMELPTTMYDGESFDSDKWKSFFSKKEDDEEGEDFYKKMCKFTLSDEGWGSYASGVVSRSGFGDGAYVLRVAKDNDKVIGFFIDFAVEEEEVEEEIE